jgi:hypothetical protein
MSCTWSWYITLLCGARPFHLQSSCKQLDGDDFPAYFLTEEARVLQFANREHVNHCSKLHVNPLQR